MSLDSCLLKNNKYVEEDVNAIYEIIQEQGKEPLREDNYETVLPKIRAEFDEEIVDINGNGEPINTSENSDVWDSFSKDGKDEGKVLLSQARDMERLQMIIDSAETDDRMKDMARTKLYSIASQVQE